MAEPSGNDGTLESNFSITFLVICGHKFRLSQGFTLLHHVHLCSLFIIIYMGFVWESSDGLLIPGGPKKVLVNQEFHEGRIYGRP